MPSTKQRSPKQNAINKLNCARLPACTSKALLWTGKVWKGDMMVLGQDFRTEQPTELKACSALHDLYTAWLESQDAETKAKHTEHLK